MQYWIVYKQTSKKRKTFFEATLRRNRMTSILTHLFYQHINNRANPFFRKMSLEEKAMWSDEQTKGYKCVKVDLTVKD